ncbi:MAG: hypothetical protein ABN480_03965, partial [Dickeya sp.]
RRSADGSVGSPHARVGNCQASNRAKGPVERPGPLFLGFRVNDRVVNDRLSRVKAPSERWLTPGLTGYRPGGSLRQRVSHLYSAICGLLHPGIGSTLALIPHPFSSISLLFFPHYRGFTKPHSALLFALMLKMDIQIEFLMKDFQPEGYALDIAAENRYL